MAPSIPFSLRRVSSEYIFIFPSYISESLPYPPFISVIILVKLFIFMFLSAKLYALISGSKPITFFAPFNAKYIDESAMLTPNINYYLISGFKHFILFSIKYSAYVAHLICSIKYYTLILVQQFQIFSLTIKVVYYITFINF